MEENEEGALAAEVGDEQGAGETRGGQLVEPPPDEPDG